MPSRALHSPGSPPERADDDLPGKRIEGYNMKTAR
jgi:hypothetical protein